MKERLQKILSRAGVASRRAAENLITAGRVTVDGEVVSELGASFEVSKHEIAVDGVPIGERERTVYFLLNKPQGIVSTAKDNRGRRTVVDFIKHTRERIYPIGRLDVNTEGLILLTNDGELMNGLLHPRYEIVKTYIAHIAGNMTREKIAELTAGIELEDGMTAPAKVRLLGRERGLTRLEISIHEGRNRQIRRMIRAVDCEVIYLKRVRLAFLTLAGVPRGYYRELTPAEVAELYQITGMRPRE